MIAAASSWSLTWLTFSIAALHGRSVRLAELVLVLLDQLLELVDALLGVVPGLGELAPLLVLGGMRLGIALHPLDFILVEPARALDADRLLLARSLVAGRHVQDAVGVDVEGNFDLGNSHPRRRNALEVEFLQEPVVAGHRPLALVDLDRDRGLVVVGRRERLFLLGGNRRVARHQHGHDAALGLEPQRERRDVQQQDFLDLAGQDRTLDGRAHRDDFIGIDPLVRLFAEDVLDDLLHARHPRRTADQHDFVDLRRLELGIFERLEHRAAAALEKAVGELLELRAADAHRQVLGARCVGRDERQVDVGLGVERQVLLGLLGRLFQSLQGHLVLAQVDPLLFLELVGDVVHQGLIPVVAAQMSVAVGRKHLEDAVGHVEDRDVERAAAQVEDRDLLVLLLLEPVGQGRRRRLVDDPRDFEAGDLPGVLGRLPLAVVKISRDRDHGFADLVPQVALSRLLELPQDHRRDLGRRVILACSYEPSRTRSAPPEPCRGPSSLRSSPRHDAAP